MVTSLFNYNHRRGTLTRTKQMRMRIMLKRMLSMQRPSFFFFLICEFLKRFYLFIIFREGKGERKRGRETSMCACLLQPLLETWPATQAWALTGNRTSDPLVHWPALDPLSHTSQGKTIFLYVSLCNDFTFKAATKRRKCSTVPKTQP